MLTVLALLGVVAALFLAAALATREDQQLAPAPPDAPDRLLPQGRLGAEDVARARFGVTLRGYRMGEVDAVLDRLAGELADRERELDELRSGGATATTSAAAPTSAPAPASAPPVVEPVATPVTTPATTPFAAPATMPVAAGPSPVPAAGSAPVAAGAAPAADGPGPETVGQVPHEPVDPPAGSDSTVAR